METRISLACLFGEVLRICFLWNTFVAMETKLGLPDGLSVSESRKPVADFSL